MPRLSVLVPAFNAREFIAATLDSLLSQTMGDFELLVSVDKSDDQTLELCESYEENDSRITVFAQTDRLGWVSNTNFLLRHVDAPFAVFAFHDDILDPSYFQKLLTCLEQDSSVCLAFSDCLLTHGDGKTEQWVYSELESITNPVLRAFKILNRQAKWWVPNRGIFRTDMARRVGGLKKHNSGEFSADFPWLFHLSLYGSFVRVPETLCFKFYKIGSLSRTWAYSERAHYDVMASCMRELWNAQISTAVKLKLAKPILELLLSRESFVSS